MRKPKIFFTPLIKSLVFILFTVGGAKIIYREVFFPEIRFLPYGAYNPVLSLDLLRFSFQYLFFIWTLLVYLFVEFLLSKHKVREMAFFSGKHKWRPFLQGGTFGTLSILVVILCMALFKVASITGFDVSNKTALQAFLLYISTTFFMAFSFELIFRGFMLKELAEHMNCHVAVLMTTVVYATIFVHGSYDVYPITQFFLGLFLGYGYLGYGFYFTWGFHFLWSFIESVVYSDTIVFTTLELFTEKGTKQIAIERTIASTVLLVSTLVLVWYMKRKKILKLKKNGLCGR